MNKLSKKRSSHNVLALSVSKLNNNYRILEKIKKFHVKTDAEPVFPPKNGRQGAGRASEFFPFQMAPEYRAYLTSFQKSVFARIRNLLQIARNWLIPRSRPPTPMGI